MIRLHARRHKQLIYRAEVVKSYLYDASVMINNLAISGKTHATSIPGLTQFGRTECFYACLLALKEGLDNWFSLTPEELYGTTMPLLLHFGRSTHILYRLAMTEDAAWDRAAVRHVVDLIEALERSADLIGSVPQRVQMQTDGSDFFTKGAAALKCAVSTWKNAFTDMDAPSNAGASTQGAVQSGTMDAVPSDLVLMDFSDDVWLSDMFAS